MKSQRLSRSRSGYTLAEVMLASIIMAFVLVSVLAVCSRCFRYLTDIRRTSRSSQVLQQEMENVRLMTWSQVQSLSGSFSDPTDTNHLYTGTINTGGYDSYSGTATLTCVTLVVTWTNQSANRVLTNSLTTLVARGGLNSYIIR